MILRRKDIEEYIQTLIDESYIKYKSYYDINKYGCSVFKSELYEINGVIYQPDYKDGCVESYGEVSFPYLACNSKGHLELEMIEKVKERFNVGFVEDVFDIVCGCGESKMFSAYYGSYEIYLRCNSCGKSFVAYSG